MKLSEKVLNGSSVTASCTGFASSALLEKKRPQQNGCPKIGVSTISVPIRNPKDSSHWYALRSIYGRERKAYEYIISKGGIAFCPTIMETRIINGKRKSMEVSRLPNIFFAYGTENEIQAFVYDNVNLPYLRFYYNYHREGNKLTRVPLIVPDKQIEGLRIICASENEDILFIPEAIKKFKEGQVVRVTSGAFACVEGRVARFCGQQRVAIVINGVLTVTTAYVPSAFLEKVNIIRGV